MVGGGRGAGMGGKKHEGREEKERNACSWLTHATGCVLSQVKIREGKRERQMHRFSCTN